MIVLVLVMPEYVVTKPLGCPNYTQKYWCTLKKYNSKLTLWLHSILSFFSFHYSPDNIFTPSFFQCVMSFPLPFTKICCFLFLSPQTSRAYIMSIRWTRETLLTPTYLPSTSSLLSVGWCSFLAISGLFQLLLLG